MVASNPNLPEPGGPRGPRKEAVPRVDPKGMDAHGMPSRNLRFCYDCRGCFVKIGRVVTTKHLKVFAPGEMFLGSGRHDAATHPFRKKMRKSPPVYCRENRWEGESKRTYGHLMDNGGMRMKARDCRFYDYMGE